MSLSNRARPILSLRWWIGGILFASTVINYIDRQTLSLLAPYLKVQYRWTNSDYATIVIGFRVAYTLGQALSGRLLDRIGVRRGLTITVVWYSVISILTSLSRGFFSFTMFRFLLGAGESANWPAATKAVSEWFPKEERALATALFDSGSSIGGAIAPFLILPIYFRWGWRPAFMIPGLLGFLWLIVWRWLYQPPERHSRISAAELQYIVADKSEDDVSKSALSPHWIDLLKFPQTWGIIISRLFTDPVWFFVTDWFPIYLVAKGIALKSGLIAIWIPFISADLGNFFGGALSGYLIQRGWQVGVARKAVVIFGGIGVTMLIPTIFTNNLYLIAGLFGLASLAYSAFSTMANVFPSDVFHGGSVASISGLSGSAAGVGTIVAFYFVGHLSDARQSMGSNSFDPIIVVAGLVPFAGMLLVLLLVRNTRATDEGLIKRI
ncbi:MFS transporter [Alloacidobacterium dinghuense]|uniref:MFS transporter n=1 Tax=Alloacidobacterium dinghuense TaxID=2763107 RepID=A0A7G8BC80_9BACT|nr:MFS transporter [Alloacidobacterium dinghuense]QNI30150.1 MFS transporter [Alloacidobacterium dinghuense]